jgi:hypothetical protein
MPEIYFSGIHILSPPGKENKLVEKFEVDLFG